MHFQVKSRNLWLVLISSRLRNVLTNKASLKPLFHINIDIHSFTHSLIVLHHVYSAFNHNDQSNRDPIFWLPVRLDVLNAKEEVHMHSLAKGDVHFNSWFMAMSAGEDRGGEVCWREIGRVSQICGSKMLSKYFYSMNIEYKQPKLNKWTSLCHLSPGSSKARASHRRSEGCGFDSCLHGVHGNISL